MSPDLELALRLADAADAISLRALPVRARDRDEARPDAGHRGRPRGRGRAAAAARRASARTTRSSARRTAAAGSGARRWILDPIDGTRNYARGIPVWATLIALEADGVVAVGVVSAPALGRRWWAERGGGACADGERSHVSAVARVEDAVLSLRARATAVPELARRAWHARGFGDFWAHMLVAEGAVDGAVDAVGVREWDLAAVQVIVEEAGGRFSDFDGESRIDGGTRRRLERAPPRRAAPPRCSVRTRNGPGSGSAEARCRAVLRCWKSNSGRRT